MVHRLDDDLVLKYVAGQATDAEKAQVEKAAADSGECVKQVCAWSLLYNQFDDVWESMTTAQLQEVTTRMTQQKRDQRPKPQVKLGKFSPITLRLLKYAAAVALAAISIMFIVLLQQQRAISRKLGEVAQSIELTTKNQVIVPLLKAQLERARGQTEHLNETRGGLRYAAYVIKQNPELMRKEEDARILSDLGSELFLVKEYDLAQWVWELAEKRGITSSALLMGIANCHTAKEQWREATACLEHMLTQPFSGFDKARASNFLGYILYEWAKEVQPDQKKFLLQKAKERLEQALSLAPDSYAKVYVNLAYVLFEQNLSAEARKALEKGKEVAQQKLKTEPNSPRLLFTLAIINARLGLVEEAYQVLDRAVQAETRNFPVAFWARTEIAFKEAGMADTQRFKSIVKEAKKDPYYASIDIVWDE